MIYIYIIYLLSGIVKGILNFNGINTYVDITALTAVILIADILKDYILFRSKNKLNFNAMLSILLLLIFYAWLCISIIYSPSEKYSITKSIMFFTNIVAFIYPIMKPNFNIRRFIKFFIIATILGSLWFIPVMLTYVNNWALTLQERYMNVAGLNLTLGLYLGICIIALIADKTIFTNNIIRYALVILMFFILMFLGARGPLMFFVLSILVFFFISVLLSFYKHKKIKFNTLLIAMLSGVFILVVTIIVFVKYGSQIEVLLERSIWRLSLLFEEDKGDSFNTRYDHYFFSISHIFDSLGNFFFGNGVGSYGFIELGEDVKDHPHNFILELLFETGLIGLLLMLFFLVAVFYRKKQFSSYNFIYFVLLYIILNIMKSGSLVDHRVFFGFLAILQLIRLRNENLLSDIGS